MYKATVFADIVLTIRLLLLQVVNTNDDTEENYFSYLFQYHKQEGDTIITVRRNALNSYIKLFYTLFKSRKTCEGVTLKWFIKAICTLFLLTRFFVSQTVL